MSAPLEIIHERGVPCRSLRQRTLRAEARSALRAELDRRLLEIAHHARRAGRDRERARHSAKLRRFLKWLTAVERREQAALIAHSAFMRRLAEMTEQMIAPWNGGRTEL